MAHGAVNDKDAEAQRLAALGPIDKEPLHIQQGLKLEEALKEVTRLSARNVDLERTNRLLEEEAGRMAVLAVRGGLRITNASQIHSKLPVLYDEELQDLSFEINEEMKRRAEKKGSKRKTERRQRVEKSANGKRSTTA